MVKKQGNELRWGLCCEFRGVPIKFSATTATSLAKRTVSEARDKLSRLCLENARALSEAIEYCSRNAIGAFRVHSRLWPLKTHPQLGYELNDLPAAASIRSQLEKCRLESQAANIRLTFHPDQFTVLNSQRPEVVEASIRELEYHGELAELIGADVINIHGGGAFGDKPRALADLERNAKRLSPRVLERLTFENDDKIYTPADLLSVCRALGVPLVYDVHHHRCLPDSLSCKEATRAAEATWNREPLFHLSSPLEGWEGPDPRRHHDFIDPNDFPIEWIKLKATIDIEAKAKEAAIVQLRNDLSESFSKGKA